MVITTYPMNPIDHPNMSVSLLSNSSLTTNVSAYDGIFSTFPAPIAPDVINCDEFYSVGQPIILEECRSAWDLLPRGSKNYPWYTDPDSGPASTSQLRLPLEIGHRQCRSDAICLCALVLIYMCSRR